MTSIRTFGSPTFPTRHLDDDHSAARKPWAPIVLGELVDPLDLRPGSTTTSPSVTTDFGFEESGTSSRTSAQEASPRVEKHTPVEVPSAGTPGTDRATTTEEKKGKRKSVPWTISMRDLDTRSSLAFDDVGNPAQRFIPPRTSSKPAVTVQHHDERPRTTDEREKRRPSDQTTFSSGFSLTRLTDEETGIEGPGGAEVTLVGPGSLVPVERTPSIPIRRRPETDREPTVPRQTSFFPEAGPPPRAVPLRHRRRTKKLQKAAAEARFLVEAERLPTAEEMEVVSALQVFAVDGKRVAFRDVLSVDGQTVCVFIRHWYCPLCAEYVESIVRTVDPETLQKARVKLVIIGNGSRRMLPAYRKALHCPFEMYTDPTLDVYHALGMTRQTHDGGEEDEKGDYVTMGAAKGTWRVVKRATKMPLGRPGTIPQLGGEFIFKTPQECAYAHRMTTTRSHAPIRDIIALTGTRLDFIHTERGPSPPALHRADGSEEAVFGNWGEGVVVSREERDALEERRRSEGQGWKVDRENELERIRDARERRRSENRCGCVPEDIPGRASL